MTDGVLHSPLVLAFRDDSRGMHLGQHECHPKCRLNVAATMDTKKLGDRPPGFPPSGTKACFFSVTTRISTTHSDTPDVNQCVHVP